MSTTKNYRTFLKLVLIGSLALNLFLAYLWIRDRYKGIEGSQQYLLSRRALYNLLPIKQNDVVFLGDSQTQRFPLTDLFRDVVAINRGIEGDDTEGVMTRLSRLLQGKPSKIFIQIGINDLLKYERPIKQVLENYAKIIRIIKAQSPRTHIYLSSIFPTKNVSVKEITELNNGIFKLGKKENIVVIDCYKAFSVGVNLSPIYDGGDGLHLSGAGYIAWAKLLRPYVYNSIPRLK